MFIIFINTFPMPNQVYNYTSNVQDVFLNVIRNYVKVLRIKQPM